MSNAPAPAPSRYSLGTLPNMVRSLLVILAIVVGLLVMLPRVNSVSQPPVDVRANARSVADTTGWPVAVTQGLPDGWVPTNVNYVRSTDGLMTWNLGYQSPSGNYVAVQQTKGATTEWLRAAVNRAPTVGTEQIAGRTWTKYVREDKTQNSLVDRATGAGRLTTVVTGTGTFDELRLFVEHLTPSAT